MVINRRRTFIRHFRTRLPIGEIHGWPDMRHLWDSSAQALKQQLAAALAAAGLRVKGGH